MRSRGNVSGTTQASFRRAAGNIAKLAQKMKGNLAGNLYQIGQEIITDIKASRPGHGVPVETGALRATGDAKIISDDDKRPKVELSFGGTAAPYALIQHEALYYHHTVGEARYLVRGVERWKPGGSVALKSVKENSDAGVREASKL